MPGPEPERRVVVVTDSTACLTPQDAERHGIVVVPLDVAADGTRYRDGVDLDGDGLAALLGAGRRVTTSQPAPAAFVAAYEQAARDGAAEVVSVHLSGELSGTVRTAGLAAQLAPLPVRVVDSRSAGMGLGFAVLAAAAAARPAEEAEVDDAPGRSDAESGGRGGLATWGRAGQRWLGRRVDRWRRGPRDGRVEGAADARVDGTAGGSVAAGAGSDVGAGAAGGGWAADGAVVAEIAERVARSTSAWFLVDSLDHLRRGGRISGPAAAFGTVLGLRPVLTLRDGKIEVTERVRTRRAARDRLVDLVLAEVARRVDVDGTAAGPGGRAQVGRAQLSGGVASSGPRSPVDEMVSGRQAQHGAQARRGVRVAVQHLGRAEAAQQIAERVRAATGLDAADVLVREVGAVLGGHLGPGALAVMVTDR